jgi:hypothetical protein
MHAWTLDENSIQGASSPFPLRSRLDLFLSDVLVRAPTPWQSKGGHHSEFTSSFVNLLRELLVYVQRWHPCGLAWSNATRDRLSQTADPSLGEFDKVMRERLLRLLDVMMRLGGGLELLSVSVQEAFEAQRRMLILASEHRRPRGGKHTTDTLSLLVRETEEALERGQNIVESHDGQAFSDDMSMVATALASMSWPATDDPPGVFSVVVHQATHPGNVARIFFVYTQTRKSARMCDHTHLNPLKFMSDY